MYSLISQSCHMPSYALTPLNGVFYLSSRVTQTRCHQDHLSLWWLLSTLAPHPAVMPMPLLRSQNAFILWGMSAEQCRHTLARGLGSARSLWFDVQVLFFLMLNKDQKIEKNRYSWWSRLLMFLSGATIPSDDYY